jgi:hypothetical protein
MKKEPFRLTIEHYDYKYVIEKDYSGVSMEELWDMLQRICLAAGYHPNTIKEYFEPENE